MRPTRTGELSNVVRTFRMSEREDQILKDYCWRYEQKPSDVIRDCLDILGVVPQWNR